MLRGDTLAPFLFVGNGFHRLHRKSVSVSVGRFCGSASILLWIVDRCLSMLLLQIVFLWSFRRRWLGSLLDVVLLRFF